jgi:hypothetical protein
MSKVYGNPFKIDWENKDAVIEYARKLGRGMTVFKSPHRSNYNICHTERTELYSPSEIVVQI